MQGVSLFDKNTKINSIADFGNVHFQNKVLNSAGASIDFKDILSKAVTADAVIGKTEEPLDYSKFIKKGIDSKVPYSYLADETGLITYNGITFQRDEKNNALCLGDMTKKDNILTIPLSNGGCLKVNRDNLDGLSKAIGMFSPEDVRRILTAIATDAKVRAKRKEIDDEVAETLNNLPKNDTSMEDSKE